MATTVDKAVLQVEGDMSDLQKEAKKTEGRFKKLNESTDFWATELKAGFDLLKTGFETLVAGFEQAEATSKKFGGQFGKDMDQASKDVRKMGEDIKDFFGVLTGQILISMKSLMFEAKLLTEGMVDFISGTGSSRAKQASVERRVRETKATALKILKDPRFQSEVDEILGGVSRGTDKDAVELARRVFEDRKGSAELRRALLMGRADVQATEAAKAAGGGKKAGGKAGKGTDPLAALIAEGVASEEGEELGSIVETLDSEDAMRAQEQLDKLGDSLIKFSEKSGRAKQGTSEFEQELQLFLETTQIAQDASAAFGMAVGASLQAAMAGEQGFLSALGSVFKAEMKALALKNTVLAATNLAMGLAASALGPIGGTSAATYFAAAKAHGIAAGLAGGAAGALSFAGVGGGGGGGGGGAGAGGTPSAPAAAGGFAPPSAGSRDAGTKTYIINIGDGFVGDPVGLGEEIRRKMEAAERAGFSKQGIVRHE